MYNDDDDEIESDKSDKEEIEYDEEENEIEEYNDEEDDLEENKKEKEKFEEDDEEEMEENYSEVNVALGNLIGRIKKNVLFMLQDRGIKLNEEEKILTKNFSFMDIFCKCMNNIETGFSREYYLEKGGKKFVHIIIKNMRKKVCLKEIKDIFSKISKINSYILIIPDKLSFDANLEIQKYKNVEIFTYDFFLFSLPRHEYVPKHILLSENEKVKFLKKRNLCIEQLPLIRKSDPIIKYYGWQKGNIVQIQRPGWIVYRAIF